MRTPCEAINFALISASEVSPKFLLVQERGLGRAGDVAEPFVCSSSGGSSGSAPRARNR